MGDYHEHMSVIGRWSLEKEHLTESTNKEVIKFSFMMPSKENSCVI